MRSLLIALLVFTGCGPLLNRVADHALPSREREFAVNAQRSVGFTTADGIQLVADIYLPRSRPKAPTILVRIPFTNTFANRIRSELIARHWAARGYAVVIQGTRGHYKSSGDYYPLRYERSDGIATLQWLAKQPWFDGRFAMWGGSSFGHTQWAIADQRDPAPTALSIQIESTSFRQMFYPGGAFSLESALQWAFRSRGKRDREVDLGALERGARHLPLLDTDDVADADTPFFNDWLQAGPEGEYWTEIDGVDRTSTLQAPVLLIGGWYDPFLPAQLDDFIRIRSHSDQIIASRSRLIVGPWGHAQQLELPGATSAVPYRANSVTLSTEWFDSIFGVSEKKLAPVSLYVMGENVWRDEQEWPLTRAKVTPFYLSSGGGANSAAGDGRLVKERLMSEQPPDRYRYDPLDPVPSAGGAMLSERAGVKRQNEIEARNDVLVYSSAPLPSPLEVTGPVRMVLYVSTDAPTTDFTAKLVDVHPDGSTFNLSDGVLRRNYSSGSPEEITIDLWPTSNLFHSGHRIRVEVSSSNFPRYDRNLNTGQPAATGIDTKLARQTVFHSSRYPSRIELPIVPR